jgi:hydrogenase nickel incorporation protein HypA/HybF
MHEMSLARSLLDQVDDLCVMHGGHAVQEVHVEIGPLSGVEPLLLSAAFHRLRGQWPAAATAMLSLVEVPLEARCRACGQAFQPAQFALRCPACGGGDTEIARGDGVLLLRIVLADSAPGAVA